MILFLSKWFQNFSTYKSRFLFSLLNIRYELNISFHFFLKFLDLNIYIDVCVCKAVSSARPAPADVQVRTTVSTTSKGKLCRCETLLSVATILYCSSWKQNWIYKKEVVAQPQIFMYHETQS